MNLMREAIDLMHQGAAEASRRRRIGEADDEYTERTEARVQDEFFQALATFRAAIRKATEQTNLISVRSYMEHLGYALDDHAITRETWDEKARGGI